MYDLYEKLNVSHNASAQEIKQAYRKLALNAHPDKQGNAELMSQINEAYHILIDDEQRRMFDQEWAQYQALNEQPIATSVTDFLTSNTEHYSEQFLQLHTHHANQNRQTPLAHRTLPTEYQNWSLYLTSNLLTVVNYFLSTITLWLLGHLFKIFSPESHDSASEASIPETHKITFAPKTWGGYQRAARNNPNFKLNLSNCTVSNMIDGLNCFLNEPCSFDQIAAIQPALVTIEDSHPHKALYQAIWNIFNSQCRIDEISTLTKHASDNIDAALQEKFISLFQSNGWRVKASTIYEKMLQHQRIDDNQLQTLLKKQLPKFDGRHQASALLAAYRQNYIRSNESPENRKILKTTINLLNLCNLYEETTAFTTELDSAEAIRQLAFNSLNWLPAYLGKVNRTVLLNIYLKAAHLFLLASTYPQEAYAKMADEFLSLRLMLNAFHLGREINTDVEMYILGNIVPLISLMHYQHANIDEINQALGRRLIYIADVFPFRFTIRSNMDLIISEASNLPFLSTYLRHFLKKLDEVAEATNIEHNKVIYFAYEAALRGWLLAPESQYQEAPLRLRLMQSLLEQHRWDFNSLERQLKMPDVMVLRDKSGWLNPLRSLPFPNDKRLSAYSDISGAKLNRQTGELSLSLLTWQPGQAEYLRLFTLFDIYQALQSNAAIPFFSLDPVDENMAFHPFNTMRFGPASLLNTALLHTMLLTDYMLKFFTTGAEVQGQHPFDIRTVSTLVDQLPATIKHIITEFQQTQHDQAAHRFWIEATPITVATTTEQQQEEITDTIALDDIQMVIKTHKLERDLQGNLVDSSDESEGWHVYRMNQRQYNAHESGQAILKKPALVFYMPTQEIRFIEEHDQLPVISNYRNASALVHQLLEEQFDNNGKLHINDKNRLLRYQATTEMAQQAGLTHHFSPEYVFAQEMTLHYDELARFIPEFMRLKALCRLCIIIRILNKIYSNVQSEAQNLQNKLDDHAFWTKLLGDIRENLEKQKPKRATIKDEQLSKLRELAQHWREVLSPSQLLQEQKTRLASMYHDIQCSQLDEHSPEIKQAYNEMVETNRLRITASHGHSAWTYNERRIKDEIWQSCIRQAQEVSQRNLENARQQLEAAISPMEGSASLINDLMHHGRYDRLASLLVNRSMDENVRQLQSKLPFEVSAQELKNIIQHGDDSVLSQIAGRQADEQLRKMELELSDVYAQQKTIVENQKAELRTRLEHRQHTLQQLKLLGVQGEVSRSSYDGEACTWVPASVYRPTQQRLVYGGVDLGVDINIVDGSDTQGRRIMRNAWQSDSRQRTIVSHDRIIASGRVFSSVSEVSTLYTTQSQASTSVHQSRDGSGGFHRSFATGMFSFMGGGDQTTQHPAESKDDDSDTSSVTSDEGGGSFQSLKIDVLTQIKTLIDENTSGSFFDLFSQTTAATAHQRGHHSNTAQTDEDQYHQAVTDYLHSQVLASPDGLTRGFAFSMVKTSLWLIAHDEEWFDRTMRTDRTRLRQLLNSTIHQRSTKKGYPQIRIGDYLKMLLEATGQQGKLATLLQHYEQTSHDFFSSQRDRGSAAGAAHTRPGTRRPVALRNAACDSIRNTITKYACQSRWSSSVSKSFCNEILPLLNQTLVQFHTVMAKFNNFIHLKNSENSTSLLHELLFDRWLESLGVLANDPEALREFLEENEAQLDYPLYSQDNQTHHPWSRLSIGDFLLHSVDPQQSPECLELLAYYGITRREMMLSDLKHHIEQHEGLQRRIMKMDAYLSLPKEERPVTRQNQAPTTAHDEQAATQARFTRLRQAGYQQHHIICWNVDKHKNHELIALSGFDLQERANKLFLPYDESVHETRTIHRGGHNRDYIDRITEEMNTILLVGQENNWTKKLYYEALRKKLADLRQELRDGLLPVNKNIRTHQPAQHQSHSWGY